MSDPADHPAYRLIEVYTSHDPVPCQGCTACCRGNQSVELNAHYGDQIDAFSQKHAEWLGDHIGIVLDRRSDGACVYLGDEGCSIYERRPLVCRGFDCRRNWLSFALEQREEATHRRLFPAAVFEAGEARIDTLKLLPEESELWGEQLGGWVLAKQST